MNSPPHGPDNGQADGLIARTVSSISDIPAVHWDALANPDPGRFNPFVTHAFLKALEDAGTVGDSSGWRPLHVVLEDTTGQLIAAAPAYLKGHSQGEYVFDYAWADAYARAVGRYYPKLLVAVPFTPVPGPRLLVGGGADADEREAILAEALIAVAGQLKLSSLHVNFPDVAQAERLTSTRLLHRAGQQFHWHNRGYQTFEDFLATFASRKRKGVRKEREQALEAGVEIELVTGRDITEAHWDAIYAFYMDTGSRKWGQPYLNRTFFSLLGASMADRCLLVMARRAGRYVAGAMNMIGGDCLYGRYWGAIEHHPCLHFEVCYYQAIDYAIAHGLARVEPGAGGEHKLARGYLPTPTASLHWFADQRFARAVADYLDRERDAIAEAQAAYTEAAPFRKGEAPPPPQPEEQD